MTSTPEPVLPASRRPMPGSPPAPPTAPAPATSARPVAPSRSAAEIQRELIETRQRLAETIDEIVDRAHPRNVVDRSKRRVMTRITTPDGAPRLEVVGGVVGALAVILLLVWWARRKRPRRLKG